jgi:hypothetical protein
MRLTYLRLCGEAATDSPQSPRLRHKLIALSH